MEAREITQACCRAKSALLLGGQRSWHQYDRVVKAIGTFIIRGESVGNAR